VKLDGSLSKLSIVDIAKFFYVGELVPAIAARVNSDVQSRRLPHGGLMPLQD